MTAGRMPGVPDQPKTPHRTIRVPDALWQAAQAKAREREETLTSVLIRALERYVRSK